MCIGQDLAETVGIYFLAFIFIGALIFYRNYLFQVFNKHILQNSFVLTNRVLFSNYTFFFFNTLKKTGSIFISKLS